MNVIKVVSLFASIVLLSSFSTSAQHIEPTSKSVFSFLLKSKRDSSVIAHATILVNNDTKRGVTSNGRGRVSLTVFPSDVLYVTMIGFKSDSISIKTLQLSDSIPVWYLESQSYLIDEIKVSENRINLHFPWDKDPKYWVKNSPKGRAETNLNVRYLGAPTIPLGHRPDQKHALLNDFSRNTGPQKKNLAAANEFAVRTELLQGFDIETVAKQLDIHGALLDSFVVYFNKTINKTIDLNSDNLSYYIQFVWEQYVDAENSIN